ncbi:MAG: efflux RND transporter periplasmic adaptor subunit, partial [Rhodoferax sp.]
FRLPERYQRKIRQGQIVELALDAFPGRSFKARIEAVDPLLDANGRSIGVRAVMPNTGGEAVVAAPASQASPAADKKPGTDKSPGKGAGGKPATAGKGGSGSGPLRPGMFARVTAVFGVNDAALVVPEEAIVPQGGKQFVVRVVAPTEVPAATGLPEGTEWVSLRQEVKLGVRRQGKVEIQDGLSEGQTMVVAGQQRLQKDGTPLRIVELGRPAASPAGAASAPVAAASASR